MSRLGAIAHAACVVVTSISLVLNGMPLAYAQERAAIRPVLQPTDLDDTTWVIAYRDTTLGKLDGLAHITALPDVSGYYIDPRTGDRHPFSGRASLEADAEDAVLRVSLATEGPYREFEGWDTRIEAKPGATIVAEIEGQEAVLAVTGYGTVELTLVLTDGVGFAGIWREEAGDISPMRAGERTFEYEGYPMVAGAEAWGLVDDRLVARTDAPPFIGASGEGFAYTIFVEGSGLPNRQQVTEDMLDFPGFPEMSLTNVFGPNDDLGLSLELVVRNPEPVPIGTHTLGIGDVTGPWQVVYEEMTPDLYITRQIRSGEFERTNVVFEGEEYFVEARTRRHPTPILLPDFPAVVTAFQEARTDGGGDLAYKENGAISLDLARVGERHFRSKPLLCLREEDAGVLDCRRNTLLRLTDGIQEQAESWVTVATYDGPWPRAQDAAEACFATPGFEPRISGSLLSRAARIRDGTNVAPDAVISNSDTLAAMILIRDTLLASVDASAEKLQKLQAGDGGGRKGLLHVLDTLRVKRENAADHPIFGYDVTRSPPDVKAFREMRETGAWLTWITPGANVALDFLLPTDAPPRIPLKDALAPDYPPGYSKEDRDTYQMIAASEARGEMLGASARTLERLRAAGDCDLAALAVVARMATPALIADVQSQLMRPAPGGSKGATLVPDRAARAALGSAQGFANSVADEEAVSVAVRDYALLTLSIATLGGSLAATAGARFGAGVLTRSLGPRAAAARSALYRGVDVVDFAIGLEELDRGLGSARETVDLARGLTPVLGTRVLEDAESAQMGHLLNAGLSIGLAVLFEGLEALKRADTGAGASADNPGSAPDGADGAPRAPESDPQPPDGPEGGTERPGGGDDDAPATSETTPSETSPTDADDANIASRDPAANEPETPSARDPPDVASDAERAAAADAELPTQDSNAGSPSAEDAASETGSGPADDRPIPPTADPDAIADRPIPPTADPDAIADRPIPPTADPDAIADRPIPPTADPDAIADRPIPPTADPDAIADRPIPPTADPDAIADRPIPPTADPNAVAADSLPTTVPPDYAAGSGRSREASGSGPSGTVDEDVAGLVRRDENGNRVPLDESSSRPISGLERDPVSVGAASDLAERPPKEALGKGITNEDFLDRLDAVPRNEAVFDGPAKGYMRTDGNIPSPEILPGTIIRSKDGTVIATLGEYLGGGGTSSVFRDGDKVVKIARLPENADRAKVVSDLLWDVSGNGILQAAAELNETGLITVPKVLDQHIIDVPGEGKFFVSVEELGSPNGTFTNADKRFRARGLRDGRYAMEPGEEATLLATVRSLNNQGVYLSDFKLTNIDIIPDIKSSTGFRAVLVDKGGAFLAAGETAAERAANARLLQDKFNKIPGKGSNNFFKYEEELAKLQRKFTDGTPSASLVTSIATPGIFRRWDMGKLNMSDAALEAEITRLLGKKFQLPPPRP